MVSSRQLIHTNGLKQSYSTTTYLVKLQAILLPNFSLVVKFKMVCQCQLTTTNQSFMPRSNVAKAVSTRIQKRTAKSFQFLIQFSPSMSSTPSPNTGQIKAPSLTLVETAESMSQNSNAMVNALTATAISSSPICLSVVNCLL